MVIDYSKAKIYKLVCNITGLIYVGATCKLRLCQRLSNDSPMQESYYID